MDQRELVAHVVAPFRALTPGQRWTTALAVGLGAAILGFGLPDAGGPLFGAPPAAAGPAVATGEAAPPAPPGQAAQPATAGPTPRRAGTPARPGPGEPPTAPVGEADGPVADLGDPSLRVAAIVAEPGPFETRSDAVMVGRLAAGAAFALDVVPATDPLACERAVGADLAIAAGELPPALRACLAAAGAIVVAHDALGSEPPAGGGPATVVSTRRGVAASLLENAERALDEAGGGGRVGIVADEALRPGVESVLPALAAAGVDVVATAYLGELDRAPIDDVLAFAGAGVDTVVYAAAVDHQTAFAGGLAVVRPGVRTVVADAADSIVNEAYPPSFDGALAVSPVVTPWSDRAGDADPQRAACRQRWVRSQTPPQVLDAAEEVRVLAWCQLLTIAAGVEPGEAAALLGRAADSLLTTELGPLPAPASWGPTASTLLRWSAGCRCWAPVEEARGASAR